MLPSTARKDIHPGKPAGRLICRVQSQFLGSRPLKADVTFSTVDPLNLRRVLENLVSNAVKYHDESEKPYASRIMILHYQLVAAADDSRSQLSPP